MFYFDMLPALKRLTKEQKADLIEALLEYAQFGVIPEFDEVAVSVAWDFLQPRIDRDAEAYELKCLKNQYSVYCREAKKGGQEPVLFEVWKENRNQSNDNERYQSIQSDCETENSERQTEPTEKGNTTGGGAGEPRKSSPYFDSTSPEAVKEAAINKFRRSIYGQS